MANNHNNRKTGAHGVTLAASATPKPDVQAQLAQAVASEATIGNVEPSATVEPTPDVIAELRAMVSAQANAINALQVELASKATKPDTPQVGNALVPAQSTYAALRRRGGPASAREVASFTSKRHVGLVAQVLPNHYVDLADEPKNNVANMVIRLLVAHNPKRQYSQHRFGKYRNGMLVSQYIEACKNLHGGNSTTCLRDLAYDCNRQYIAVLPPGSKVDANVGASPIAVTPEARAPFGQGTPVSPDVLQRLAILRASLQQ